MRVILKAPKGIQFPLAVEPGNLLSKAQLSEMTNRASDRLRADIELLIEELPLNQKLKAELKAAIVITPATDGQALNLVVDHPLAWQLEYGSRRAPGLAFITRALTAKTS